MAKIGCRFGRMQGKREETFFNASGLGAFPEISDCYLKHSEVRVPPSGPSGVSLHYGVGNFVETASVSTQPSFDRGLDIGVEFRACSAVFQRKSWSR